MDKNRVEPRNITMYPRQWATVQEYAKDNGFTISLALRRIVDEWHRLRNSEEQQR